MQPSTSLEGLDDHQMVHGASSSTWEIEEEEEEKEKKTPVDPSIPTSSAAATAAEGEDGKGVYVAIGNSKSSMDALSWALRHVVEPSSSVYLIHVFPVVRHIPTPLGMMPKNQLSKQQVESYLNKERAKRREMLQKFSNMCHDSKVDFYLIESDEIVKAIVELIPVVNIRTLIVGTSKSNLRKWRRGITKAEQIHKKAPNSCEVKIICDGKEISVTDGTPPPSPSSSIKNKDDQDRTPLSSPLPDNANIMDNEEEQKNNNNNVKFCRCFPV
ncbi:U-box domain-containing protein 35 isoform X2 [Typha angustifolia]|uniref:U-box domain-containing protein 35 isoform X2 n=1 Tax=Typha angustifolia TaxID=59011 RepID=UPI003C2C4794